MIKRRLKVLHTAVSMNPSVGVSRQMEWEQRAADVLDLPWDTSLHTQKIVQSPVVVCHDGLPQGALRRYFALRKAYYQWLEHTATQYDLVLLRHSVHDVFEARLAGQIGRKLITVHHTLEMPELRSASNVFGPLRAVLEHYIGRSSLHACGGIVAVTEEILRFERSRLAVEPIEKPGLVYPNGIVCSPECPVDNRGKHPELLFVAASFSNWHGLDLLLDAMERDSAHCSLHLVGSLPDALARRCCDDARIQIHGPLGTNELTGVMRSAWCGISSFALYRQGMSDACTLKVREYLDGGLPVYAGHRDAGLPESFPYFRNGPVDLAEILSFAFASRSASRAVVKAAAAPFISKVSLLSRLYGDISRLF